MGDARKLKLTSYEDLFTTEESRIDNAGELVMEIPLSELHAFKDQPFKVRAVFGGFWAWGQIAY